MEAIVSKRVEQLVIWWRPRSRASQIRASVLGAREFEGAQAEPMDCEEAAMA